MAALYLKPLDDRMKETELYYARYMDDWVIISPNRWKLRKAVTIVNQILNRLKVEKHPDKTFIGRAERGFDFLGYRLKPSFITLAAKTLFNFLKKALRLYEQEPLQTKLKRLGEYIRRGLGGFAIYLIAR